MNQFILLASIGSDLADMGKSTAQTFGVNGPHLVAQIISFVIVAFLLQRFAYKPVIAMLEERRRRIEEGLANAEKIKQELANAQVKAQDILTQANAQANKAIEDARAAASKVQESETQKAIAAAEQIIAKAREAAAADHARMLAELKREVGRLVVQTTATVTGKVLTTDDQKRLADETAKQLAR
ncbi:MAG TPA: F0F1 ATP synthase subunit B [Verrucomicrobiae bacterium]|nr:F0F1 ATP synthase subunit B [Verrucomicrobiae bacterium]